MICKNYVAMERTPNFFADLDEILTNHVQAIINQIREANTKLGAIYDQLSSLEAELQTINGMVRDINGKIT